MATVPACECRGKARAVLAALGLLAVAPPVLAHEVLHEVQHGRAVAVHVWIHDGEDLANAQAVVFSPADGSIPYWSGRTDRSGWLAFVPDVPGRWRVRIVDSTGHGLDTAIEVAAPGTGGVASETAPETAPSGLTAAAVLLRPLVGVVLIAVVFGLLYLRRRRPGP